MIVEVVLGSCPGERQRSSPSTATRSESRRWKSMPTDTMPWCLPCRVPTSPGRASRSGEAEASPLMESARPARRSGRECSDLFSKLCEPSQRTPHLSLVVAAFRRNAFDNA